MKKYAEYVDPGLTHAQQAAHDVQIITSRARELLEDAAARGIVVRIEPEHDLQDRAMGHYDLKVDVYPGATVRKAIEAEERAAKEASK